MVNANIIDFNEQKPPEKKVLPQGAESLFQSSHALLQALFDLHAPFLNRHPQIHACYLEAHRYLDLVGMYANKSINMIMNPDSFPLPEEKNDAPQESE